jgi:hypothetical protein
MARNTIQIRLKRISTSVHSAGCSSTKRMMIWNMPSAAARASIAQAHHRDRALVQRSRVRKAVFMGAVARLADSAVVSNENARYRNRYGRYKLQKM